ncbi:MAG: C10 family peptidase, partial [Muribaculaceae bacterium]|nr:C10 family peptidase [Muribaculaceae bacterium]
MKRILFFALIMGLVSGIVEAAPVSENAARAIAAQFMAQKRMGVIATAAPKMLRGKATSQPALYVFNAEKDQGWVIVSGDDRTRPVLGYSDHGNYDPNNVPENMKAWLDQYVEEIACLDEGETSTYQGEAATTNKAGTPVAPMLSSQWDQGAPFNLQCPKVGSNYCVTGCVATAMAQIMYYYKWPSSTSQTIPGYKQSSDTAYDMHGTTYPALSTTTFNWNIMKDYYSSSET